jgi:hypothetical protein
LVCAPPGIFCNATWEMEPNNVIVSLKSFLLS